MSQEGNTVIAKQLDYKPLNSSHPTYKLSKVLPLSGGQTVTVTPSGGQETLFEIPTKCFNLAQSILYYSLATPAGANAKYNWLPEDILNGIQQIQLYTRSGQYLCDLQHIGNYLKVVGKKETPFEEYITLDAKNRLYLSNSTATTNYRPDNTTGSVAYTEPKYLQVSAQEAGGSESVITQYIQFRLGRLLNTVFALNKDLLFGEVLVLRIVWQAGNRISWYSDSATNATTNATASANNHSIASLALYLAIEQNQEIVNSLSSKLQSGGLSIPIDYVHAYKTNLASESQTVSLRFNSGHGMTLKKIIHSVFNNTETVNKAFDNGNVNGAKVKSYYTLLDNNRLQEFNLTSSTNAGEDYMYHRKMLDGSVILNHNMYMYNWFHCDDFSETSAPIESEVARDRNLVLGIPIRNQEHKWDFYGTMGNTDNYNHYTFAVAQKMLTIAPSQVVVV